MVVLMVWRLLWCFETYSHVSPCVVIVFLGLSSFDYILHLLLIVFLVSFSSNGLHIALMFLIFLFNVFLPYYPPLFFPTLWSMLDMWLLPNHPMSIPFHSIKLSCLVKPCKNVLHCCHPSLHLNPWSHSSITKRIVQHLHIVFMLNGSKAIKILLYYYRSCFYNIHETYGNMSLSHLRISLTSTWNMFFSFSSYVLLLVLYTLH